MNEKLDWMMGPEGIAIGEDVRLFQCWRCKGKYAEWFTLLGNYRARLCAVCLNAWTEHSRESHRALIKEHANLEVAYRHPNHFQSAYGRTLPPSEIADQYFMAMRALFNLAKSFAPAPVKEEPKKTTVEVHTCTLECRCMCGCANQSHHYFNSEFIDCTGKGYATDTRRPICECPRYRCATVTKVSP